MAWLQILYLIHRIIKLVLCLGAGRATAYQWALTRTGPDSGIPGISERSSLFWREFLLRAAMPGGSYYQVTESFTLQDNLTII